MSNSKTKFNSTDLICLECGNINTIQRRKGRGKAIGHIKTMYCPLCMNIVDHYEVQDVSKFVWEYSFCNENEIDDDVKLVLELLKKREDSSVRGEDKIFKKVLTRK